MLENISLEDYKNTNYIPEINWKEKGITEQQYKEIYRNYSITIVEDEINELDDIKHDIIEGNVEFKYGLPSKNIVAFKDLVPLPVEPLLPKTPTENFYELLNIDKDGSYESMVLKYHKEFNTGTYLT